MSRRDRYDQTPEDRFVIVAYEFFDWVVRHKAACAAAVVAAVAVVLGGLAWWGHLKAYNESAVAAFEAARKPEDYKAVTDSYPGSPVEPLALFYQGRRLVDEKRYKEAEETFLSLARSYPGHYLAPDARVFAAMTCAQQKNWDDAVKHYRAVADEYPASFAAPRALLGMGSCLESMHRPAEARAAYEKIIASYKTSGVKKDAETRLARLGDAVSTAAGTPAPAGTPAASEAGRGAAAPADVPATPGAGKAAPGAAGILSAEPRGTPVPWGAH